MEATMSSALEKLADHIRNRRKLFGISQEMLAEKTGLSLSLIRRIERKAGNPTLSNLEKIARVLETNIVDLFNNNNDLDAEEEKKNIILIELRQLSVEQLMLILKFIQSIRK